MDSTNIYVWYQQMQDWTNTRVLNDFGYNLFLMLALQWERTIRFIFMANSLH